VNGDPVPGSGNSPILPIATSQLASRQPAGDHQPDNLLLHYRQGSDLREHRGHHAIAPQCDERQTTSQENYNGTFSVSAEFPLEQ
jgi:hypothetical protein